MVDILRSIKETEQGGWSCGAANTLRAFGSLEANIQGNHLVDNWENPFQREGSLKLYKMICCVEEICSGNRNMSAISINNVNKVESTTEWKRRQHTKSLRLNSWEQQKGRQRKWKEIAKGNKSSSTGGEKWDTVKSTEFEKEHLSIKMILRSLLTKKGLKRAK